VHDLFGCDEVVIISVVNLPSIQYVDVDIVNWCTLQMSQHVLFVNVDEVLFKSKRISSFFISFWSYIFRTPDLKRHVSCCHHLVSVVCKLKIFICETTGLTETELGWDSHWVDLLSFDVCVDWKFNITARVKNVFWFYKIFYKIFLSENRQSME
jgi:hypothetical protein